MPNCDFYGSPRHHAELLTWLFEQGTCEVYEMSSEFEQPLRRFYASSEVVAQFDHRYSSGERWRKVYLQLYVVGAGPPFVPRRISLNPRACGGATFRYGADGWGLVQLYLGNLTQRGELESSHTNHFSRVGAETRAVAVSDQRKPDLWDFAKITSFSSRLNREIRKRGVSKLGSRVLLPGALELRQGGITLLP